ncbi:MAG: NAD(P)-binding protein [Solirubrobacteraceae bacterium]|nr:NAD(P)-binding protein [Solirubrobacteraceae bacterium]
MRVDIVHPLRPGDGVAAVSPVRRREQEQAPPPAARRRTPESGERVVVGGGIAALVAADAIAATDRPVRLLLPARGVGGGFAAIRRDGHVLELGVRLLELEFDDPTDPPPPLTEYRPDVGGHRRWAATVDRWVRDLVGDDALREIRPPRMIVDGRDVPDILFTVDLDGIAAVLPDPLRRRMLDEARAALAGAGDDAGVLAARHARRLGRMTLADASVANHGPTFHARYVAALCDKVLAGGADAVAATLRRRAWAPLFHPRTLVQALAGEPVGFRPRRPLLTVAPDGCGGIVDRLLERLRARPTVRLDAVGELREITATDDGRVAMRFDAGPRVVARRPLVACSATALMAAAGIDLDPPRVRTVVSWLDGPAEDLAAVPDLVHVLDPANPVLRVSRGGRAADPARSLLTVELRHDVPAERVAADAVAGLRAARLVGEDAARALRPVLAAARPSFPVPSPDLLPAFAAARERLDALGLDVELAAGALSPVADTLNDQVVQGLRAAERSHA